MSELRRVLMVSFFYPPDPAVGGRRVSKFVENLPEFGWSPTVLTARTARTARTVRTVRTVRDATPQESDTQVQATRFLSPWQLFTRRRGASRPSSSPGLREKVGGAPSLGRGIYRALRHLLPMSTVRMPDATLGWVPFSVAAGRRLLASARFDALFSSAGPPSSHIVAAQLQRDSGLPWIADYRDLWSDNHWDVRVGPFKRLERRFERRVLANARVLTTVSPPLARQLAELHAKPVEVIYNGFDLGDFPRPERPGSQFVLTYIGSIYRPGQDPEPLIAAIARVASRSDLPLTRIGFRARFLGTAPGIIEPLVERYGVGRWVQRLDATDHHESLRQQVTSAALLYLGWADPAQGIVTAKIFEYLGARRPILAVGPQGGVVSKLLRECGIPDLTNDSDRIAATLGRWIREFVDKGDVSVVRNEDAVRNYARRSQTRRLAHLLDQVAR